MGAEAREIAIALVGIAWLGHRRLASEGQVCGATAHRPGLGVAGAGDGPDPGLDRGANASSVPLPGEDEALLVVEKVDHLFVATAVRTTTSVEVEHGTEATTRRSP
ncbi:hypothetical protein GCM10017772_38030 [Promicromonospora soli]|uniref:Uncharacterized protein n=1 Tax=Promicromonospora soli TaxID=2035533 RepID=A0A919G3F8_9MICO|nr:hypothetical protein GCM10017772_38030 [Promicromonospora soli]